MCLVCDIAEKCNQVHEGDWLNISLIGQGHLHNQWKSIWLNDGGCLCLWVGEEAQEQPLSFHPTGVCLVLQEPSCLYHRPKKWGRWERYTAVLLVLIFWQFWCCCANQTNPIARISFDPINGYHFAYVIQRLVTWLAEHALHQFALFQKSVIWSTS